jgi:uracil-DNA glycosylase
MDAITKLIEAVRAEAKRAPFPVDTPVYERAEKDPSRPILFAGSLDAPFCVFGRDLGKDEVAEAQPLIGAGGRLVRAGFYLARQGKEPPKSDRRLTTVLDDVLLTNTVPFKPPGNKAYTGAVKDRFRPFVAELLGIHWKGNQVITLGTEAFQWFAPYADASALEAFWSRDDRYESAFPCVLTVSGEGQEIRKPLTLLPLPHPSPLNQRWYKQFPDLLARRLTTITRGQE